MSRRDRTGLRARRFAVPALVAWLVGFELLPGLHLAPPADAVPHSPPRPPAPLGPPRAPAHGKVRVVATPRVPARFPAAPSAPPDDTRARAHAPEDAHGAPFDPRHGDGSLEHHGLATLAASA